MITLRLKLIIFITVCLTLVVAALAFSLQSYTRYNEYKTQLQTVRTEERTNLLETAALVQRNGTDEVLNRYIFPCTQNDQQTFERHLANSSTILEPETRELLNLFPACGEFFARQKNALVERLRLQYQGYRQTLLLSDTFDSTAATERDTWDTLITLEQERAQAFAELVTQQKILIMNKLEPTESVETLLAEAAEIQSRLNTLSTNVAAQLEVLQKYEVSR